MIQLKNVSKRFGDLTALHPLDMTIQQSRVTALIGPSGCGKSTLLRIMLGLITPTSGEVWFKGQRLSQENVRTARIAMGYVIQDGGLFPHLTAEENVALMARHLKMPLQQQQTRLQELCELTDFPLAAMARYPAEISGGQRQRVGLMRALMLDPEVLLLDEPLGALDPMTRSQLQTDLKAIFQKLQKTVVLVTHDMAEAAYFADTIVLMREGIVVQQGSLEDLRDRPVDPFARAFLMAQRREVEF